MAATKNPRARLEHILFHIRGLEETIAGISFETFTSVYYFERTATIHLPALRPVIEQMLSRLRD